jgi:hypothetical protein
MRSPVDAGANKDLAQSTCSRSDGQANDGWNRPFPGGRHRAVVGIDHGATGCCELAYGLDNQALGGAVGLDDTQDPLDLIAVGAKSMFVVPESSIDDCLELLAEWRIQRRDDERGQNDRRVKTPARIAVNEPYTRVRLMSRSMSKR